MELEQLIALLAEDEARSRPFRAERLRLLFAKYGNEGIRLFPGGVSSVPWRLKKLAKPTYMGSL